MGGFPATHHVFHHVLKIGTFKYRGETCTTVWSLDLDNYEHEDNSFMSSKAVFSGFTGLTESAYQKETIHRIHRILTG